MEVAEREIIYYCYIVTTRMIPTWCLTSTETTRLIRNGEKEEGGGTEVGEEGDYIPIATMSPPE